MGYLAAKAIDGFEISWKVHGQETNYQLVY